MAFHDTYMPVNITRCSNNYGPYQFPEKLIPLMIHNVKNQQKPAGVWRRHECARDWLYVEDHCKAIDMVAENGRAGEVYNVGGHNERPNIFIVKPSLPSCISALQIHAINDVAYPLVAERLGHDRRYGIDPRRLKMNWAGTPKRRLKREL